MDSRKYETLNAASRRGSFSGGKGRHNQFVSRWGEDEFKVADVTAIERWGTGRG